ncbi:hypothetical protein Bca52824_031665 [Brassica carinata]|uniref:Uncharacterized protein n=1 Tax=Brassica carinata TaxID=52824 RepID=A0A8X7V5H3_BRACI|nr:hypothetical protein Bca52824_031665 [Brassica carinata]
MEDLQLPPRMFAAGEEPLGDRVNSYHKFKKTEALRGYVDAIQLVFLAAIPQLKEEVTQSEKVVIAESDSDGESPDEVPTVEEDNSLKNEKPHQAPKYYLIPGHAKNFDTECEVPVKSIIDDPFEEWSSGQDFGIVDGPEDPFVETMVRLIDDGFAFRGEMFKGGLTSNDLSRLRAEKKPKEKDAKEKTEKEPVVEVTDLEAPHVVDRATLPSVSIHGELRSMEKRLEESFGAKVGLIQSTVSRCLQDIETKLGNALVDQLKIMEAAVIRGVVDACLNLLPPL